MENQMTEIYKLYRRDGDVTSIEAAESLNVNRMERIVYDVIDRFGPFGCIQDQELDKSFKGFVIIILELKIINLNLG